jgi:hypothetical protein
MIRCHFALDPLVLVFTCFFAVGAAAAAIVMHDWTFISALLFILVFGSTVSWGERELIMGRLAAAINAHPLDRMRSRQLVDPIIKHLKGAPDERGSFNCTDNSLR